MALTIICGLVGLSGGIYYEYRRAKNEAQSRIEKDEFDAKAREIFNTTIHGRVRDDIFNEKVYQEFVTEDRLKDLQQVVQPVN
uniref:Uncharacterized protein U17 n=1 Tax=Hyposoter didymator TaxID=260305 RepID=D7P5P6_HYPDD|nr:unknown [Hyposoter didymator]